MRKFLVALCLSVFSLCAAAADLPAVAGLKALRAPMEEILREAARGQEADLAAVGKSSAEVTAAWKPVMTEVLDLQRYGVPAAAHEEARRQIRLLDMIVGYLDESARRGDRALMLRAAGMLRPAYDNLAATLGLR